MRFHLSVTFFRPEFPFNLTIHKFGQVCQFSQGLREAGVTLYKIVGSTLLSSHMTFLLLLNKAEINHVLHQQCCTV